MTRRVVGSAASRLLFGFVLLTMVTSCSQEAADNRVDDKTPRESSVEKRGHQLPDKSIYCGMEGLRAIEAVKDALQAIDKDARLIAAFPADHTAYIDLSAKLQYTVAKTWVVTFYSHQQQGQLIHLVAPDGIQSSSFRQTEDGAEIGLAAFPTIGNQEALALANEQGLLRGAYRDVVKLHCIKINDQWRYIWKLPYFGSQLPIWIDAVSGRSIDIAVYTQEL